MSAEDHSEPVRFRQVTEPTEEELDIGMKQDLKLDSAEELTEELVVKKPRKNIPAKSEKSPPRFSDEEC